MPPYTSITMLKEEIEESVKYYEVEVAFDNKGNYGEVDCPVLDIDNGVDQNFFEKEVYINTEDSEEFWLNFNLI